MDGWIDTYTQVARGKSSIQVERQLINVEGTFEPLKLENYYLPSITIITDQVRTVNGS